MVNRRKCLSVERSPMLKLNHQPSTYCCTGGGSSRGNKKFQGGATKIIVTSPPKMFLLLRPSSSDKNLPHHLKNIFLPAPKKFPPTKIFFTPPSKISCRPTPKYFAMSPPKRFTTPSHNFFYPCLPPPSSAIAYMYVISSVTTFVGDLSALKHLYMEKCRKK